MARKTAEGRPSLRSMLARSPEIQQVARQLAALALARLIQDGPLGVRQIEQLRRALATAGDALGWAGRMATGGELIADVSKDVLSMSKSGAKTMAKELVEELVRKRDESAQLSLAAESARKMSEDADATYPAEIIYLYTVRDASQNLVTKTETVEVNDAREALAASETIERNITSRGRLTDLMVLDLQKKQGELDQMTKTLTDFVKSSHGLLKEVLVNLQ